jgi:hypothetical protein
MEVHASAPVPEVPCLMLIAMLYVRQARLSHQELEQGVGRIVKLLACEAKTHKQKLIQQHKVLKQAQGLQKTSAVRPLNPEPLPSPPLELRYMLPVIAASHCFAMWRFFLAPAPKWMSCTRAEAGGKLRR